MTSPIGKFFHYFNIEEQKLLVEKFGTSDKKELKNLMKQIIVDYISNNLDASKPQQEPTLDNKLKKLKVADLTLKVWDKLRQAGYSIDQLQRFVSTGKFEYPENRTFHAEPAIEESKARTLGTTISHQPEKILQNDGTLRCKVCNKRIDMRAFDFEQLDDYRIHFETTHRKLEDSERKELLEIYPK